MLSALSINCRAGNAQLRPLIENTPFTADSAVRRSAAIVAGFHVSDVLSG